MFERLVRVNAASDESQEVLTARKVAAIVATLTTDITGFSKFDHRVLPRNFADKLVGYMHGFSLTICAAWRITEPGVPRAATRIAASFVLPHVEAHYLDQIVNEIGSCAEFSAGREAGLADGNRYVATGRRGTALIEMLMDRTGAAVAPFETDRGLSGQVSQEA
ncbi:hypothetical protein AWB68_03232 [Caballeronia choica]|jgi:hypothetical protein|uniref:Uncharacterized protein n=1 Tax=Caballeronia choica TaxID=326476 RepID=A0A158IZG8_9BURK|nr:hypothetical protein [Caballeronia choica]SAL61875.1 hypothetical protein AWB68_03232 [Caballeronia choica]